MWLQRGIVLAIVGAFGSWYSGFDRFCARLWRIPRLGAPPVVKDQGALRVGLIGASQIAKMAMVYPARHAKDVVVQAVGSRSKTKAEEFARQYEIPFSGTTEEILRRQDIDAVYISVPSQFHTKWARMALENNKHVLLEKPLTTSPQDAIELEHLADKQNLVLYEAMHSVHHPAYSRLIQIATNELGQIKLVECRFSMFDKNSWGIFPEKRNNKVKMLDRYIYQIDLLRRLTGLDNPTKVVSAVSQDFFMHAQLEYGNVHCNLTADASTLFAVPAWDVRIIGEKKSLFAKNFGWPHLYHYIQVYENDHTTTERIEKIYGETGRATFEYQLEAFLNAVRNGGTVHSTATHAAANLQTALAIDNFD